MGVLVSIANEKSQTANALPEHLEKTYSEICKSYKSDDEDEVLLLILILPPLRLEAARERRPLLFLSETDVKLITLRTLFQEGIEPEHLLKPEQWE